MTLQLPVPRTFNMWLLLKQLWLQFFNKVEAKVKKKYLVKMLSIV